MITPYCTKFDRLTNRKFIEIVGTRGQILMAKWTEIDFGWGSAPDPAGGADDAPPDPLVGWGGGYPLPIPYPPWRLWRLDPRAFGARLGACGASIPRSSRLQRSAASQRLKPTLLLPSGAATGPPTAEKPLKFRIFENSGWRHSPFGKSQKSRYLRNGLTDLWEMWYADAKWVS